VRIDFYESGVGETTIITFPGGGIGIVDAHPSAYTSRPDIFQLVEGKKIHFVCLTHPHTDHGRDLVGVFENAEPEVFWHTIPDFKQFIYRACETQQFFPSPNREFVEKYQQEWANVFLDIFAAVQERHIPKRQLRADLQHETIDGVEIHFLSPEEKITQDFIEKYAAEILKADPEGGDPNLLSAILALRYRGVVVILGADALKRNWEDAIKRFRTKGLPKALLIKVPHHGASNAMELRHGASHRDYLEICSRNPIASSVIFAGDAKHPEPRVYQRLTEKTHAACLSNGLMNSRSGNKPLSVRLPGVRRGAPPAICHPVLSYEISENGELIKLTGGDCSTCPNAMPQRLTAAS